MTSLQARLSTGLILALALLTILAVAIGGYSLRQMAENFVAARLEHDLEAVLAALSFDAISAGRARSKDVVLVDTAGRLPTQLHLMDELKKIRRTITKASDTAPHEVLLVIDGNTGQNALAQVKSFDDALQLTGLIVTKLDGTAKGGVLCAIAREKPVPVYFVGVGEKLEDLRPFNGEDYARALLGHKDGGAA